MSEQTTAIAVSSSHSNRRLMPPEIVRGMTVLDRTLFRLNISLPCLRIASNIIGKIIGLPAVRTYTISKLRRLKPIICTADDVSTKLMLFDPERFTDESREILIQSLINVVGMKRESVNFYHHAITLEYDDWDWKRCIRSVLPENLDFSGFTHIGHIAQCNLRPELLPYRFVIGQLLLDKVSQCRTVVNKLDKIENKYRIVPNELIAGDDDYITEISEHGCRYRLDLSKTFWNTRLGDEHYRLVQKIQPNSLVYDVFAGIGPFVIPAAMIKSMLAIFANDLNPSSVEYMRENILLNKVDDKITVYNMDAADFICQIIGPDLIVRTKSRISISAAHIIMNLPGTAIEFLQYFVGFLNQHDVTIDFPIFVHCYLFSKLSKDQDELSTNPGKTNKLQYFIEDAKHMVISALNYPNLSIIDVHLVRNVAPRKEQLCVTFELPYDLIISTNNKRRKLNE